MHFPVITTHTIILNLLGTTIVVYTIYIPFALMTEFVSIIIYTYAFGLLHYFSTQVVASFGQPPLVVRIRIDSGYGVVSVSDSQKIQCTTCKHKKHRTNSL